MFSLVFAITSILISGCVTIDRHRHLSSDEVRWIDKSDHDLQEMKKDK